MSTWTARLDTDFKESLLMKDSEAAVFVMTGHTASAEARTALGGTLKETATVTVTDAATGAVDVEFTDTQINTIGEGRWVIDVKVVRDSDSYIFRTASIDFYVLGRVTA